ncbi:hypothetical protein QJS04_geneDACA020610 [Acorus gramineus]|uniref:Pectinesterase inhibitor domain-containing protein n=1 Tax=Acorus gramineus TaxID=55184 RepID=A0AAV9B7R2_ACOGR|nr:hypothetical protein QJS04_geneDACA020610 [Acorus gramineus]
MKLLICMLLLLTTITLTEADLIGYACSEGQATTPNFSYKFCVDVLRSDPKTNKSSLHDLSLVPLRLAISKATSTVSLLQTLLRKSSDPRVRGHLTNCLHQYSEMVTELIYSVEDIHSGDYFDADLKLRDALNSPGRCEDGFRSDGGGGGVSPVKGMNDEISNLIVVCELLVEDVH